eukprot:3032172-Alexandrium_andersonii.AAC.1
MSASLVGSEMCIRDRPPRLASALQPTTYIASGARAVKTAPDGRLYWPVSYTHLTLPTICSV